tara:strand:- start:761 stop:1843 length:1083 start_codon:yes stop_codon:yes gene_type:complete
MIIKIYQKYIYSNFIRNFIYLNFIFFCIVVIINFFEELRFSEKYNTEIYFTIYLSFINAPSLIFEIFPFIFLIAVKLFYLNLIEKDELSILNSNGISNSKIILNLSIISGLIGILLILIFYFISSSLKSKYLDIKNSFSNTNEYLAVVNDDGLWIKEEIEDNLYIIHAEKFDRNELKSITITEADKYYNNKQTIISETANINSKNWQLSEVILLDENGKKNNYKSFVYNSSFNGEIISNLFSNLNSLNIFELHELSNSYKKIGYSNTDIKLHLNKIYSMPIFYILMTILGYLVINKLKVIKSKFFIIIFGVFISVIVYYLNYFSGVLGNKGALPIYLSIWTPLLILFLFCNIGMLKVNEN